jgi:hypothetical protein
MADQIKMPKALRQHLLKEMIGKEIEGFTITDVLGCGNTAVTYKVLDKNEIPWALKLVTRESYGNRAPFREVARFSETDDERFLVFPKEIGDSSLKLKGKSYDFVWFKSRPVKGISLEKFLVSETQFNSSTEILRFVENLAVALDELERIGFRHGDLHDRNIMQETIGKKGKKPEIRYVIIDFSEAHPVENPQEGLSEDLESFGQHIRKFSDVVYQRETLTREDERILAAISHIPGLVNGKGAKSDVIAKPFDVLESLQKAVTVPKEPPRQLEDPFFPLNTENILNDALLADLCLTEMPWTSELEKIGNVLLIGPRGCGKTMIFRRLRLKTKIAANKCDEIRENSYVAFYLPCESLFYMRFSDFSEVDIDRNKDALILFFNMSVLAEVCSTLSVLPKFLGSVSPALTLKICELMKEETGPCWKGMNFPAFITSPKELMSCAEHMMRHIRRSVAYGKTLGVRSSTDFVTRLIDIVKKGIVGLSKKFFIFFLDDYTEGRVPMKLQEALHPIVCQRSPDICFKISAHMFGSIYDSPRPLSLDEGRNIIVINLGSKYLQLNKRHREGQWLLKILNARFKYCKNYNGTIEKWLGKSAYPGGRTLSRAFHNKDTRSKAYYHGVNCLMELCTGDYSEMIRMVGEIFREAHKEPGSKVQLIPPSVQSRAIYRVSREYLSRIRHVRPDGQKLYDIVDSFGTLSKNLLSQHDLVSQGTDSKGRPRKDPYDLLTIYVDDIMKASPFARSLWRRLQKASVIVNIGLATSQTSRVADRGTLRRIYCPAFRIALTDSEHLRLNRQQFEYFMDKPREYCKSYFKRSTKKSTGSTKWEEDVKEEVETTKEIESVWMARESDRVDFIKQAPTGWTHVVEKLPELTSVEKMVQENSEFDLYIGAMGFEDRTIGAAEALVERGVRVKNAVLLEFDRFFKATENRRKKYGQLIKEMTSGLSERPLCAIVDNPDNSFSEKLQALLETLLPSGLPKIVFDCTSCPSLILSKTLMLLLNYSCELTVLYSEAGEYFPTREEWESSKPKTYEIRLQSPFEGVRYVAKPPVLQADDFGEYPVLLILFPTFNTERTGNVLDDIDPAERIWFFGEPHDLLKNSFRIDMEKAYAAPIISPGDKWLLASTFDYRKTLLALASIFAERHSNYRIVVMPHGSKMQSLAVNLFARVHQLSMVFAMPQKYDRFGQFLLEIPKG